MKTGLKSSFDEYRLSSSKDMESRGDRSYDRLKSCCTVMIPMLCLFWEGVLVSGSWAAESGGETLTSGLTGKGGKALRSLELFFL